ncbi:MAG: VCBS repeat-containing protein [Labilithrix sp.]|nr:VCBS repeat-containing protein [Labilithrix sp.]
MTRGQSVRSKQGWSAAGMLCAALYLACGGSDVASGGSTPTTDADGGAPRDALITEPSRDCSAYDPLSPEETVRVDAALCRLNIDVDRALPPMRDEEGNALLTPHEVEKLAKTTNDPKGEEAIAWHPLGRDNVVYHPEKEVFAAAALTEQTRLAGGIYEMNNRSDEWSLRASLRDTKLMEIGNLDDNDAATEWVHHSVKAGTAGDFDGDGIQEAAVVYLDRNTGEVRLNVYAYDDTSKAGTTTTYSLGSFPHYSPSSGVASPGHVDIAAGDIDGDGRDELIVALGVRSYSSMPEYALGDPNAWNESTAGAAKIIVLDDKTKGFAKLTEKSFGNGDARAIYVATGNGKPDARHRAEIAVSVSIGGQAKGFVYQYTPTKGGDKLTLLMDDSQNIAVNGRNAYLADVTFADLNHDRRGEFIFAGIEKPGPSNPDTKYVAMSLQYDGKKFSPMPSQARAWTDLSSGDWAPSNGSGDCGQQSTCDFVKVLDVFAEPLDIDGDGKQELLINNWVVTSGFVPIADKDGTTVISGMLNNDNSQPRVDSGGRIVNAPHTAFHRSNTWIAVGDFTGNGKDQVLYWGRNKGADRSPPQSGDDAIRIFGWDTEGNFRTLGHRSLPRALVDNPSGNYPVLFGLNADADSAHVKFKSSHTNYTEPSPLAAVAAAPCFASEEMKQNLDGCRSAYTKLSSRSSAAGSGIHVFGGIAGGLHTTIIGSEDDLLFGVYADYEGTTTKTAEVSESNTWEAGANQDMVVFTSIPIDEFLYEVTSVGTSKVFLDKQEIKVGDVIKLAVPRQEMHLGAELAYYNRVMKDLGPSRVIGPDVFKHTPGDPHTYPPVDEINRLEQEWVAAGRPFLRSSPDKVVTVPHGASSVATVTLGETEEIAESRSHEVGFKATFSGNKGTFAYEVEAGVGFLWSVELADTTGFELEGSIGGIGDDALFERNRYRVGASSYFAVGHTGQMRVVKFWRDAR